MVIVTEENAKKILEIVKKHFSESILITYFLADGEYYFGFACNNDIEKQRVVNTLKRKNYKYVTWGNLNLITKFGTTDIDLANLISKVKEERKNKIKPVEYKASKLEDKIVSESRGIKLTRSYKDKIITYVADVSTYDIINFVKTMHDLGIVYTTHGLSKFKFDIHITK